MLTPEDTDPWPRMRAVVKAVVTGTQHARLIEETLDTLCTALGATSAWSTFESKERGPIHHARTSSFHTVAPAVLAEHVTRILSEVENRRRTIAGPVPYAQAGSFAAVPLWSPTTTAGGTPRFVAAIYLDFPHDQGTQSSVLEFLECVAALLGTMTAQQALAEAFQERLREQQAKANSSVDLDLDVLLATRSMRGIRDEVRAAIRSDASIVILGESGTGKTQLATAIARASNRTPIVRATLGFSDDLNTITSELFGHERGAFSGAASKRKGLVEYADGGTLILDEVLNLSPHAQQLLLDFTQFGTYRPLGYQGRDPKKAELRLIAVTNGDIRRAIADTRFRQDLYFRLATVPLILPPLRERRQDIPDIAVRYLRRKDLRKEWIFSEEALSLLSAPHLEWEGNIRELEAVLERAKNRAATANEESELIEAQHLDLPPKPAATRACPPTETTAPGVLNRIPPAHAVRERWSNLAEQRAALDAEERKIIRDALLKYDGVVAQTARELSVSRTSLISRMATLNIKPDEESSEHAR